MTTVGKSVFDEIDAWLKQPGQKSAGKVDSGADGTSHPAGGAAPDTQAASEGARSAENTSDVKAAVPNAVDGTPDSVNESGAGGENTPALDIGVSAKATGEDKAHETGSAKAKVDDPGTTHPAKAGTEKYAELLDDCNEVLADIAVACAAHKQAAAAPKKKEDEKKPAAPVAPAAPAAAPAPVAPAAEKKAEDEQAAPTEAAVKEAREAGAKAAEAALAALDPASGGPALSDVELITSIHKAASLDAAHVAEYLASFSAEMKKQAEGLPPEAMAPAADPASAGAVPPEAGGQDDAALDELVQAILSSGLSIEDLIAALQAGGGGEAAVPAAAAGAVPAEAALPPEAMMPPAAPAEKGAEKKEESGEKKEDAGEEKEEAGEKKEDDEKEKAAAHKAGLAAFAKLSKQVQTEVVKQAFKLAVKRTK